MYLQITYKYTVTDVPIAYNWLFNNLRSVDFVWEYVKVYFSEEKNKYAY